jgi:hypothetical protein
VDDAELLESFVALFEPLEEPIYSETVLPASQQATGIAKLEPMYSRLPAKFPDLYEKLILSHRWQRSDIHDSYCLLANPHGSDLDGLAQEIFRDENLSTDLLSNGFIQFGFQSAYRYDPICFRTNGLSQADYPIVHLDHEEILCNGRIKVIETVADSFREFVEQQISKAPEQRR